MLRSIRLALLPLLLLLSCFASAQTPDLSGTWKQDNARSTPARNGETVLVIEQHGLQLRVETTTSRPLLPKQHAVQRYTLDGKPSVSTGADGDRFTTSIEHNPDALIFHIVEEEDGKTLQSTETWSLDDYGAALRRVRTGGKHKEGQILYYKRVPLRP